MRIQILYIIGVFVHYCTLLYFAQTGIGPLLLSKYEFQMGPKCQSSAFVCTLPHSQRNF